MEIQNTKFKAMKFWIGDNPQRSEQVQKMLFSLGYTWDDEDKVYDKDDVYSLYTDKHGDIALYLSVEFVKPFHKGFELAAYAATYLSDNTHTKCDIDLLVGV